jgi:hypothetical protein
LQALEPGVLQYLTSSKCHCCRKEAFKILDNALTTILQLARISPGLTQQHAAQKLPSTFICLSEQLQAAVQELQARGTASAVLATIKHTSDKLLKLQHARSHIVNLYREPGTCSPAADAVISTAGSLLFAQVVLDAAAVLQRRHEQMLQLVQCLGFSSCSSLAACLQPASKVNYVWQLSVQSVPALPNTYACPSQDANPPNQS